MASAGTIAFMRKGQLLDEIEDVLKKADSVDDVRSVIASLARDHGVKLEGGGGGQKQGLGVDDFGIPINEDDDVLESGSIFGTKVRVNLGRRG